jgi:hypothetical protein
MAAQSDHFSTKGVKKCLIFMRAWARKNGTFLCVWTWGGRLREYEVNKYVGVQGGWVDSNAQGIICVWFWKKLKILKKQLLRS